MNILLVDDQPEAIAGVLIGVNWESLDIDRKFTAYDIIKAKSIIENNDVELMLCDIEMPLGSGLELYKWVLKKKYKIKCIFLTAHADFSYMQSAIKMHGFDYLLQPATHEQIEESIRRAVDKIKMENMIDNYCQYGKIMKKQEDATTESLIRDYLLKYSRKSERLFQYMKDVSIPIKESTPCQPILLQVLEWPSDGKWDPSLFQYAISNVLRELLSGLVKQIMTVTISNDLFFVIYFPSSHSHAATINQDIINFIYLCRHYLLGKIACYEGKPECFSELPETISVLRKLAMHNVAKTSKLFLWEEMQDEKLGYVSPDCSGWTSLADQGLYKLLQSKILQYLGDQTQKGNMSIDFLRHFHQDFIYWFFSALSKHGIIFNNVFSRDETAEYSYDAVMNSYTSLDRMKNLIAFAISYLSGLDGHSTEQKSHMNEILAYIHKNIHRSITRKDVADAVYLNPEYLSRLFKKEKGCTLHEFINNEKMDIAKSMLESTNFSVSIVASKVGFSNFSHFAQCFKKRFGITPSEVNREVKKLP